MFPITNSVPSRNPAIVTWTLIAINCAVFLFQVSLGPRGLEEFVNEYALIPARYFAPVVYGYGQLGPGDFLPFLTMTFLHGGWLHLILNMWTLYLFGRTVEDRLGPARYLAFYLACGLLAAATHAAFNPTSVVPALGASGAIAGIMGCFIRMFPRAQIIVLLPILFLPLFFELPAFVFMGLWFLLQVLQGAADLITSSSGAGVAWWAHVGGFIAGLALGPLLTRPQQRYRTYYGDEGLLGYNAQGY
jgi:membrane associated rhomboid family serine protease